MPASKRLHKNNEIFSSNRKKTFFVDLFVRVSNKVAINMYTNLGYIVYRTVLEYYSGDPDEDAFGEFFIFFYFLVFGGMPEAIK